MAAGTQGSEYGTLIQMAPIVGIIAIFYFLIIRPQTQKASEHTKMLGGLKKNDEVITNGGMIGRITDLGDKVVTLEVAPNVRVRIERAQVMGLSTYGKTPTTKS